MLTNEQEGRVTLTTNHHEDCDGYRFAHVGNVRKVLQGRGMVQADCDICDWTGHLYGIDGTDAAHREARNHTQEVTCDGRCQNWGDER